MKRLSISEINSVKYGKLSVLQEVGSRKTPAGNIVRVFMCLCDCGKKVDIPLNSLRKGNTKSCGCGRFKKHGMAGKPSYIMWASLKSRCQNKNNPKYKNYGARGVKLCKRWQEFENFYSDMGEKPSEKHSIDRIDNNGDYTPQNCRWSLPSQQTRNRRSNIVFNGECAIDASRRLGGHDDLVSKRIKMGWSKERAFTKLPRNKLK